MVEIIPSILTPDPSEARLLLSRVEEFFERVHIDIVDGQFEPDKTIDPSALEAVETSAKLDFHLMTKEPTDWVERALRAGADRVIGQVELMASQLDFIGKVSEVGLSVGLALDIETPVENLDETILTNLDVVLVMSVKAGAGGQEFDPRAIKKIKKLGGLRAHDPTPFRICVDGGITTDNIGRVVESGADEVTVGKRLIGGDIAANLENYKKALEK
jgi:ribulose-phosphate 3-epimerase